MKKPLEDGADILPGTYFSQIYFMYLTDYLNNYSSLMTFSPLSSFSDPNYQAPLGYFAGRKKTIDAHVSRERPVESAREGSSTRARITGPSEDAAAALAAKVAAAAATTPVPASEVAPAAPSQRKREIF